MTDCSSQHGTSTPAYLHRTCSLHQLLCSLSKTEMKFRGSLSEAFPAVRGLLCLALVHEAQKQRVNRYSSLHLQDGGNSGRSKVLFIHSSLRASGHWNTLVTLTQCWRFPPYFVAFFFTQGWKETVQN